MELSKDINYKEKLIAELSAIKHTVTTVETSQGHRFNIFNIGEFQTPFSIDIQTIEEVLTNDLFIDLNPQEYNIIFDHTTDRSLMPRKSIMAELAQCNIPTTAQDKGLIYIPIANLKDSTLLHEMKHLTQTSEWEKSVGFDDAKYQKSIAYLNEKRKSLCLASIAFVLFSISTMLLPEEQRQFTIIPLPLLWMYVANFFRHYYIYSHDPCEIDANRIYDLKLSKPLIHKDEG